MESQNRSALDYLTGCREKLLTVTEPLRKNLGLKHFAYLRYHKDGSYVHFCDNLEWVKARLENNLNLDTVRKSSSRDALFNLGSHRFLWSGRPTNPMHATLFDMNIWNGHAIYDVYEDFIEVWGFGTARDNEEMNNFYLKNHKVFKQFGFYFKDQCRDFIYTDNQRHMFQDNAVQGLFDRKSGAMSAQDHLLQEIQPKKFYLNRDTFLTRREYESVYYLSRGLSAREAAENMGISSRTVEGYIENAKARLGCTDKGALVRVFMQFDHRDL